MNNNAKRSRRRRTTRHAQKKRGLPPGTAVYTGEIEPGTPVSVRVLDYGPEGVDELEANDATELLAYTTDETVTWLNVDGVHDVDQVQVVAKAFGVHPLWVEDIVNPASRPKCEAHEGLVLVLARMVTVTDDGPAASRSAS